jgi:hypothetical protein
MIACIVLDTVSLTASHTALHTTRTLLTEHCSASAGGMLEAAMADLSLGVSGSGVAGSGGDAAHTRNRSLYLPPATSAHSFGLSALAADAAGGFTSTASSPLASSMLTPWGGSLFGLAVDSSGGAGGSVNGGESAAGGAPPERRRSLLLPSEMQHLSQQRQWGDMHEFAALSTSPEFGRDSGADRLPQGFPYTNGGDSAAAAAAARTPGSMSDAASVRGDDEFSQAGSSSRRSSGYGPAPTPPPHSSSSSSLQQQASPLPLPPAVPHTGSSAVHQLFGAARQLSSPSPTYCGPAGERSSEGVGAPPYSRGLQW